MSAKTIFVARKIRTMDPGAPVARGLLVLGDRVIEVGEPEELKTSNPDASVEDLGAAVIVPGFNDAHQHLSHIAEQLGDTDLVAARITSAVDLHRIVSERATDTPQGKWLLLRGYDDSIVTGPPVTRSTLDRAAPDHPVLVIHSSGHWGIANSAALLAGGLDDSSSPPDGGDIGRDEEGRLNGLLYEEALFAYTWGEDRLVPAKSRDDLVRDLAEAQRAYHALGITSVCDALVGRREFEMYCDAHRRDELSIRVAMLVDEQVFEALATAGMRTTLGDQWLKVAGVKAFADGAISGRTCAVSEPIGESDNFGIRIRSDEELRTLTERAHRNGLRVGIHANGDLAIEAVLAAIEQAQNSYPDINVTHRIEHCTILTPELRAKLKDLGVAAVPFGSYVAVYGERLLEWYGAERCERMFAHRDLLDDGIVVGGSSDYPAGELPPLLGIQSMVTRRGLDGTSVGPRQRVSIDEALWIYTVGSASAAGEAHVKGSLTAGMLADFVVLAQDPTEVPEDEISGISVDAVAVGGRIVYRR